MKNIITIVFLLVCSLPAFSQVVKSTGVWYFMDSPNIAANPPKGVEVAYSINEKTIYGWDRVNSVWIDLLDVTSIDDEQIEDIIAALLLRSSHTGISISYDDVNNTLSINANDPSATNEIQSLVTNGAAGNVSISDGNTITINVNDADADPTNELYDDAPVIALIDGKVDSTTVDSYQDTCFIVSNWYGGVGVPVDTVCFYIDKPGVLLASNNLSDVSDASTSRANIGADVAANVDIIDANSLYIATDVENALQEEAINRLVVDALVGDLIFLSGLGASSKDLGVFSGSTISDGETVKGALQDLETAVETKVNTTTFVDSSLVFRDSLDIHSALIEQAQDDIIMNQAVTIARIDSNVVRRVITPVDNALPAGIYFPTVDENGDAVGAGGWGRYDEFLNFSATADTSINLESNTAINLKYKSSVFDNLNNPARGIYSIRKLTSTYSGPAFTVENNAGDTLQVNFLGSVGSIYDTTAVLAFDDTVYVKRWYDQSPLGNNLEVTDRSISGKGPLVHQNGLMKDNDDNLAVRFIDSRLSSLNTLTNPWGTHTGYSFAMQFQSTGTNFGPIFSNRGFSGDGLSMYYTGGNIRVSGRGYNATFPPYAIGTITNVAPENTAQSLFAVLSTENANVWRDTVAVTLSSSLVGDIIPTADDSLLVVGRNTAGSVSFWHYDGYLSELIVWGKDASTDRAIVGRSIFNYYNGISNDSGSSGNIYTTLPAPDASILNQSFTITHLGEETQETTVKTSSGSGYFKKFGQTLDSLIISSLGNPTVTLKVLQDFDANYYYSVVSTTEQDQRLLDSIDARLAPKFIFTSDYTTIDAAISAATSEGKTLVVDNEKTKTGSVDIGSLSIMFTHGGRIIADTVTSNDAVIYSPGPRQIFKPTTRILGDWNLVGDAFIEFTTGSVYSDSVANWNGLINATTIGKTKLLSNDYRIARGTLTHLSDKPITIYSDNAKASIITLIDQGSVYFSAELNGAPIGFENITIRTKDFEQGNYNTNSGYNFVNYNRSASQENVLVDVPYFEVKRCVIKGEVEIAMGATGTASTNPTAQEFSNSGIKLVQIEDNYFEGVRDFLGLNNTFSRRSVVNNNEVRNLFGAFFTEGTTYPDSLSVSSYDISEVIFTNNTFTNDSSIVYVGGAYFSPLVVKAQKVYFTGNTLVGLAKSSSGADFHVCYPSAEFIVIENNEIIDCWEAGEGSIFKFKGAEKVRLLHNIYRINQSTLVDAGLVNSDGELIDSSSYALAFIDKEEQSLRFKTIQMTGNTISVPILNKSTDLRDVSGMLFQGNTFNINRIEAEPPAGWIGNTQTNTIFYANQNSALRDTTSSFVFTNNVWNIKSVENNKLTFAGWNSPNPTGNTNRLNPYLEYSDTWNVNDVELIFNTSYVDRFVNKTKVVGNASVVTLKAPDLSGIEGYEFKKGIFDIESSGNYASSNPVFPINPDISGSLRVDDNNLDTLIVSSGKQSDWFSNGWIGANDTVNINVEINYEDLTGKLNRKIWKVRYINSTFRIQHYQNNTLISYNPTLVADSIIQGSITTGPTLESIISPGTKFELRMTGLLEAKSYTLSLSTEMNSYLNLEPISTNTPTFLTATATLDFGSTAANAIQDLTMTVSGAAAGDRVIVAPPVGATTQGHYTAFVSGVDTVTIRFVNDGAGSYDPGSGIFTVTVIQ